MSSSHHKNMEFEERLLHQATKGKKRRRWRLLIPLSILILIFFIPFGSNPEPCDDKIQYMENVFLRVKCFQQIKQQADALPDHERFRLELESLDSYIEIFNDPDLLNKPCSALRALIDEELEMLSDIKSIICEIPDIFQNLNCLCNEK